VERKRFQYEATKKIRSLFSVVENVSMPILENLLGKMQEDINKMDIGCSEKMLMESINTSLNTFISGKRDMEKYHKVGKFIISICNVCQSVLIEALLTEIINGIQGKRQGRYPANLVLDESAAKMLDEMSGESKSGKGTGLTQTPARSWKNKSIAGINRVGYEDKGGASRFFKVI